MRGRLEGLEAVVRERVTMEGHFKNSLLIVVIWSGLLASVSGCGPLPTETKPPSSFPLMAPSPTPLPTLAPLTFPSLPVETNLNVCQVAMRPGYEDECAALTDLPRYIMALEIDVESRVIKGRERILFVNREDIALETIVLRLYANLPPPRGGRNPYSGVKVDGISIEGQEATFNYQAQNTAIAVRLPFPLAPGQKATMELDFAVQLQADTDGIWQLTSFYPMLAIHDETGWRQDLSPIGDAVYSESAFYTVYLTVPNDMVVVTSGVEVAAVENPEGTTTYLYCTGPVRDFALAISEDFQVTSRVVDDITINVYYMAGDAEGEKVIECASETMAIFNRKFGFYPYAEFDVVVLPGFSGGTEYPGLIFISDRGNADTEFLVAHEVAHQWWYGVVGNDILQEPWLDEAFAQYSAVIYFEERYGEEAAQEAFEGIRSTYQRLIESGQDGPVGQSVWDFDNNVLYVSIVYNKGGVFLDALRQEVGDEAFFAILQEHYRRYKYRVATGGDFLAVAEDVTGRELDELYDAWIRK